MDWDELSPDEHTEWVNQIETFFAEASQAYSDFVRVKDVFPQKAHDVAESLVDENISLRVLKVMLKNASAAPLLKELMPGPALAKLILFAQGELDGKVKESTSPPRKKSKLKHKMKKQKNSEKKESLVAYELEDIRRHPVLKPFHPWLKHNPTEWDPLSTPKIFKKAFAVTAAHAAALLRKNSGANLASFLTVPYLRGLTGFAEAVFRTGNGGLVIVGLDYDKFEEICCKHIPALEEEDGKMEVDESKPKLSLTELRKNLKKDWDKAAVEELKKRPSDDPLVKMIKNWSTPFMKQHKLLKKFS